MAKYRHNNIIVEAGHFRGFYAYPYPPGVESEESDDPSKNRYLFYITTSHNERVYLEPGDWVIAEPDGHGYYSCKPNIFAANYTLVNNE